MDNREWTWIAVMNGREGRLLRGRWRSGKSRGLRLEEVEAIGNPLLELDRSAPGETEGYDPRRVGSRRSELFARYAVDLVKWLDAHVKKHSIEELEVFASPRLLPLLRSMYPAALAGRAREHSCNFNGLTVHELECHPEMVQLVENGPGRSSRRAS